GPSGDSGSPHQPGCPRRIPSPIAAGPALRRTDHRAGRLRLPPGARGRRPPAEDSKRSLPSMSKKKAGAKKPTAANLRGSFGDLDFEAVRELARIANEFDLSEVETDPSGRIRLARRLERAGAAPA